MFAWLALVPPNVEPSILITSLTMYPVPAPFTLAEKDHAVAVTSNVSLEPAAPGKVPTAVFV